MDTEVFMLNLNDFNLRRTILGHGKNIKKDIEGLMEVGVFRAEHLGSSLLVVTDGKMSKSKLVSRASSPRHRVRG